MPLMLGSNRSRISIYLILYIDVVRFGVTKSFMGRSALPSLVAVAALTVSAEDRILAG
jgi:hypothetical protein